jgi:peptide/nickel transport system substrate-binding protein
MLAKTIVHGMTRRPFTVYDAAWKLVPMLATELPTIENGLAVPEDLGNGKRGIAITLKIDPRAVWGDGTPITAEDILLAWEIGKHPDSGVSSGEGYRRVLSIDVKGPKTVVLHNDRIEYNYNAISDFGLVPAHLEREAFKVPAEYRNRTKYDTDPTNPGLSCGPYRVTGVTPGAQIALEPNPRWWGEKPFFRRIVFRILENTAALEANLQSGAIDYVAGELGLSLDQAVALEKRRSDRYTFIYRPGLIFEHIDLNQDNPILRDVRVRQALLLSIDRKGMAAQLFGGHQPVADSPVSPLDKSYLPEAAVPFDLKRAGALLDEAGWKAGPDGKRRNAAGEPLSLELMTTAGNRSRELVQQVLAGAWKAVGIDIRIRNQPARVFFGETVAKRKFEAMAMFAWVSAPDDTPRTTLHSSMIPSAANAWSGQNNSGFSDPQTDSLIDRMEVELDVARRTELRHQLQRRYAEMLPALPLYWRADPFVIPKWLTGVEPTGTQFPSTLWVERWRAI